MCRYAEDINEMVLTKEDHGDKLFEVMGETLKILTTSGYTCEVYADEPGLGIYVIKYDFKNPDLTANKLLWVDTEKYYISECGVVNEEDS